MAERRLISRVELAKHNNAQSVWIAVHGKVYDVTPFLGNHPGGDSIITDFAGVDATESFEDAIHSKEAFKMLDEYFIGLYAPNGVDPIATEAPKDKKGAKSTKDVKETKDTKDTKAALAPPVASQPSGKVAPPVTSPPPVHRDSAVSTTKSVSFDVPSSSIPQGATTPVIASAVAKSIAASQQNSSIPGERYEEKLAAKDIIRSLALGGNGPPVAGKAAANKKAAPNGMVIWLIRSILRYEL
eukprot:TRINITY_DN6795_c0_g1_i1.p1 TRINITY_DN6795_c0_g1~~TRINITY_DN6795_c0_g1_i1.p1  ORF type:complete len:242 (+),score=63.23 TRINITY_DN6795_c0_g1_i1:58-783(+)